MHFKEEIQEEESGQASAKLQTEQRIFPLVGMGKGFLTECEVSSMGWIHALVGIGPMVNTIAMANLTK